jgi:hypothetical protein
MSGFNGTFDATQFDPTQGTPTHPVGKFPAYISKTEIKANKDNTGGYLAIELTTQAGVIVNRYNLFSTSAQAVEIAQRQLSALCHATGVYKLDFNNEAAALRNARLQIEVGLQKGQEPGGYTEVKRVFDGGGNEPGKATQAPPPAFAAPQAPAPMAPPIAQPPQPAAPAWGAPVAPVAPAPAWGAPQPTEQAPVAPAAPAWGAQPSAPAAPVAPPINGAPPAWQQAPGAGAGAPPWGPR